MKPILFAMAALTLGGCASNQYGYAYCYDAYRGPVGYYTGPFEPKPACAATAATQAVFVVHENGYRGPYVSGPHPGPVAPAAVDAASPAAAR